VAKRWQRGWRGGKGAAKRSWRGEAKRRGDDPRSRCTGVGNAAEGVRRAGIVNGGEDEGGVAGDGH
jgi:hypothetical protein